jgi:ERCC4-type nuclease
MSVNYNNFKVIIDTREQQPWEFERIAYANRKLDTGDYSVEGYENLLCIERKKSVSEIANNVTEKRFKDVIERMKQYKYSFLILEFDLEDIYRYPVGSNVPKRMWNRLKITPGFIIKNLLELQLQHNIHVVFCGDASNASKIALTLMKKVYELEYREETNNV